jgi:aldehyde dehydrogenase (NAD+)
VDEAARRDVFESDDPYHGQALGADPARHDDDVDRAVRAAAHRALTTREWPKLTASKRGALLRRLGDLVTERSAHLAASKCATTASSTPR